MVRLSSVVLEKIRAATNPENKTSGTSGWSVPFSGKCLVSLMPGRGVPLVLTMVFQWTLTSNQGQQMPHTAGPSTRRMVSIGFNWFYNWFYIVYLVSIGFIIDFSWWWCSMMLPSSVIVSGVYRYFFRKNPESWWQSLPSCQHLLWWSIARCLGRCRSTPPIAGVHRKGTFQRGSLATSGCAQTLRLRLSWLI